mgnify:CR=1 FL=1
MLIRITKGSQVVSGPHIHRAILLNNNKSDPILWEELNDIAYRALKESLMTPPLDIPLLIPFFLFVYEKEGNALGV